jgi:hypothetical protein
MPDQSPAETLTAAAQALRDGANAVRYEIKTNAYWHGVPAEGAWDLGVRDALGGHAGMYAAMFDPKVGDALAALLDDAAGSIPDGRHPGRALAVARALLGGAE